MSDSDEHTAANEQKWSRREHVKFYSTWEYAELFSRVGLVHLLSSRVKMSYPLKVHVGAKDGWRIGQDQG